MNDIKLLNRAADNIRILSAAMVEKAKSGHPGGSLGCADYLTALFFEILEADPAHFAQNGRDEDMFFLSNGHITPVFYSVLARRGYFPVSELATFRELGTRLQGHPTPTHNLPGVRVASGSLGQGLSVSIGAALAKKANQDNHIVYTLTGDGELQEGQNWEAIMFASANKVDNLILTVDYNGKQIDGPTDDVCSLGNLAAKFEAFDWIVLTMDGNNMSETVEVLKKAKSMTGAGKPIVILMRTEMGMGVDFMMGTHKWHGTPPNDEQAAAALAQLPETLSDF